MSDSFMVYCYTRRPKNGYLTQNWVFGPITPETIGKFNSLWNQTNVIWSWSMGRKPIKSTTDRPDMKPISLQARSASAISTFIGYYRWDKQQQKFERFFFFLEKSAVLLGRPMWPVSLDDFNKELSTWDSSSLGQIITRVIWFATAPVFLVDQKIEWCKQSCHLKKTNHRIIDQRLLKISRKRIEKKINNYIWIEQFIFNQITYEQQKIYEIFTTVKSGRNYSSNP